ncbi:tryptophan permease, partial [Escherichia coli]|nr:tryptophan permease [Escherichia coli]
HGNIPGLVTYYRKDGKAVMKSLLIGTLISLAIYILWQFVVQGNIPREGFKQVIADGGNIGNLLAQMRSTTANATVSMLLDLFSY